MNETDLCMSVFLCLCKRPGLLRDGTPIMYYYLDGTGMRHGKTGR